jgi:hypothetical protein
MVVRRAGKLAAAQVSESSDSCGGVLAAVWGERERERDARRQSEIAPGRGIDGIDGRPQSRERERVVSSWQSLESDAARASKAAARYGRPDASSVSAEPKAGARNIVDGLLPRSSTMLLLSC